MKFRISVLLLATAVIFLLPEYVSLMTTASGNDSILTLKRQSQDTSRSELVHIGDLIDVDVVGSTDFDWRGRLDPEGFLDGLGFAEQPVFGRCRRVEDIAIDVAKGYAKLLRSPEVVVRILDRSGRANITLYGAVKKPHRFLIKRKVLLNELLISSGGLIEKASGEVEIVRSKALSCEAESDRSFENTYSDVGSRNFIVDFRKMLTGDKASNPEILEGDIITVREAPPVYVIGGVVNPRQISLRTKLTLSRAIASAGGFTRYADTTEIVLFRREGSETQAIKIDLPLNANGGPDDPELRPYDVIEVGQKGRASSKAAPYIKQTDINPQNLNDLPLKIIE